MNTQFYGQKLNYFFYARVMLELNFEKVGFSVEARPRTSSHTINVTLGAIYLRDHITEKSLFPILIAPQVLIIIAFLFFCFN